MSFKKIEIIQAETVRNPETDYVYLGYGYTSTHNYTGLWLKDEYGNIIPVSGGTSSGSGGTSSYWVKQNNDIYYNIGDVSIGTNNTLEKLTVDGAINIGTTTSNNGGTIRYTGTDFEGYKVNQWVSLTASGGTIEPGPSVSGTSWTTYDYSVLLTPSDPGSNKKIYIGDSFSPSIETYDRITTDGAITLGQSTFSNIGTIQYSGASSVERTGFYGHNGAWKKLDIWDLDKNDRVYLTPGTKAYINLDEDYVSGGTYSLFDLNVGVHTSSYGFVSRMDPAEFQGKPGGFGVVSGTTGNGDDEIYWGVTDPSPVPTWEVSGGGVINVKERDMIFINGIFMGYSGITDVKVPDGEGGERDLEFYEKVETDEQINTSSNLTYTSAITYADENFAPSGTTYTKTEVDQKVDALAGGFSKTSSETSENFTTGDEQIVGVGVSSGSLTRNVTLDPSQHITGKVYTIVDEGGNASGLNPINITSSDDINGSNLDYQLIKPRGYVTLYYNGSEWLIIGENNT